MILSSDNALFLEELYQTFRKDAGLVPLEWSRYFQQLELGNGSQSAAKGTKSKFESNGRQALGHSPKHSPESNLDYKKVGVQSLIESYRRFGNLAANLDPLSLQNKNRELLELGHYGLSPSDLEREFPSPLPGLSKARLKDIIQRLESSYCSSIGIEYAYIRNTQERDWFEKHMESEGAALTLDLPIRRRLYEKLVQAETFENFWRKNM